LDPFAVRCARLERFDAATASLERMAAAADAERARLAEAVEVSRQALLLLHDALSGWAGQPARAAAATVRLEEAVAAADARAERLVEAARTGIIAAAAGVGAIAADRVTAEIAPARAAAEAHAAYLRASLDRMRGEADALGGAQAAIVSLEALCGVARSSAVDALDALARRSAQAGDAAERAAGRLAEVAERLDPPPRRARAR
jgi:hypothetical protein